MNVFGVLVKPSDKITLLDATLDNKLTLSGHVHAACKATFFHIRALRHIRSVLTERPSRVRWWAQGSTTPTQFCMECRAQIFTNWNVCKTPSPGLSSSQVCPGVMDMFKDLHWLPVRYRIDFKIATLVYKVRSSSQPVYLSSFIPDYASIRSLRSTGTHILHTLHVKTAVGSRAFTLSAPEVWSSLPDDIRDRTTLLTFRRKLKTFYFNQASN